MLDFIKDVFKAVFGLVAIVLLLVYTVFKVLAAVGGVFLWGFNKTFKEGKNKQ